VQFGSSLDERFDRWDVRAAGVGEAMQQDHDRAAGFARLDVRHVGYLSDSAMINDLDIAYSLKRRDGDSELFMKRIAEKVRKEKETGRRFSSYLDELSWPELEVLRALKGRSAAISLHSTDDEILQRTPVRELYRLPERPC
jgi:hypothetical protein